jgi:HK97 family phage prohead protease
VFNVWTEINSRFEGHFLERFAPGSFKRTFNAKKGSIPPLLEHGQDPSIWKKPLGDVAELCEDATGAYYEVSLYDTLYVKEILPAIASGHYGASFRFSAPRDDFIRNPGISFHNPKGIAERTVLEANVTEFSLVLFPAYLDTTAGVRSLTDYYNPQAIKQALDEFAEAQESLRDKQEHVENISIFLEERHLRAAQEAEDEVAEVQDDFQRAAPDAGFADAGFGLTATSSASYNASANTYTYSIGGITYTAPTGYVMLPITVQSVREEPEAPEEEVEAVREDTETTREQQVERLYKRSYQVLGDSVWAVHPGMLEVYLNIMAERRAGYRPTQAEIDERISQRGMDSIPETIVEDTMAGSVEIIDICGSIMPHGGAMSNASSRGCNVEDLQADFNMALKDDNVKAVLFNIDSPGGSVDLIPEFADAIREARGQKPIVAMVNTMAASAAYWLASACDKIIITPSGEVGSIGVYSCHSDISEKLAMDGVKKTFVSAGKYKTDGNPYEPLSPEAEKDMQAKVDSYYQMFVEAVAEGRGITAKDVEASYGEGRMILADEAVALGMADSVLTLDEALKSLDPEAEAPVPDESEEDSNAPTDDKPEPPDDDPVAHLSSAAREPDVNNEPEDEPSWRI